MAEPKQRPGRSKQVFSTPSNFIRAIKRRLGIAQFAMDLAANRHNAKAAKWLGPGGVVKDALEMEQWATAIGEWGEPDPVTRRYWGWLNPPFARIEPWARRCWMTKRAGGDVVLLVPAGVGSNWFRDWVDGKALVLALNGRLAFMPDKPKWLYPKDCILAVYSRRVRVGFEVWTWGKQ